MNHITPIDMARLSRRVVHEINKIVASLVENGLADDQNDAFETPQSDGKWYVGISGVNYLGSSLKNIAYPELYESLRESRSFNVKMLDGGLIQLVYSFRKSGSVAAPIGILPVSEPCGVPK